MILPDEARLVMPLLKSIGAALEPVSVAELAGDPVLHKHLQGTLNSAEDSLRWLAGYLESEHLVTSVGESRFSITVAGMRRLQKAGNSTASDERKSIAGIIGGVEQNLRTELLARLYAMSPAFFESVVVQLLVAMGYGNGERGMAKCLGRTGDGGIDGVVTSDELGLDPLYIQAKRYRPGTAVPVNDIRDFSGSLEQHGAVKGIFATTSTFTKPAQEFAGRGPKRIVLIDGARFCGLMLKHNIGVRTVETWELKAINGDYFTAAYAATCETSHISSASIQPRR